MYGLESLDALEPSLTLSEIETPMNISRNHN
jgi:hypothetical protein